jgi:pimeloyl-ACP methyl ester carboxylesterase
VQVAGPGVLTLDRARAGAEPGVAELIDLEHGFVHFEVVGAGEPVVLVHGLFTPMFVWDEVLPELASRWRVLRYDQYGRGLSERPTGSYGLERYVAQLDAVCRSVHGEQPVRLVAYSWGCGVAAAFAAAWPGRVRQLVLLAPGGLEAGGIGAAVLRTPCLGELALALGARQALAADLRRCFAEPERFEAFQARVQDQRRFEGYERTLLATLRGCPTEFGEQYRAAGERVAVDVLWGTADRKVPVRLLDRLRGWLPGVVVHLIEGAEHGLLIERGPEVAGRLVEVLSR